MAGARYRAMKAWKAAKQFGIDFTTLTGLPSGRFLSQSSDVSPLVMRQLETELERTREVEVDPVPAPAPAPQLTRRDPITTDPTEAPEGGEPKRVFQLARE